MNKNLNCRAKVYRNDRAASKADQANAFPNAKRGYERYVALAKASSLSGDSVETENYYQHAEHYLRLMIEQAGRGCVRDGQDLRSRMEFQNAIPESTFKAAFVA
jgi:hypothetical protein